MTKKELDKPVDEIKKIHEEDEYTEPQYRLWVRMIQNGIHVSKHDPPQISLITGVALVCKKQKIEESNVKQTIVSTAIAIVKALVVILFSRQLLMKLNPHQEKLQMLEENVWLGYP